MLNFVIEALVFWGVFFGMLVAGLVLVIILAWVVGTVQENKRRKNWANRYYNRH